LFFDGDNGYLGGDVSMRGFGGSFPMKMAYNKSPLSQETTTSAWETA